MSIALDGFAVLQKVGTHADVFVAIRADADKAARALVVKCLKAKSSGLDSIRAIRSALGDEPFALLLDGLKDTEIKSVLTRVDKHFADLKQGTAAARRLQLAALAEGSAQPSLAPAKAAKKAPAPRKAKKTESAPTRLKSEVMDLFREGGKRKR